MLFLRLLPLIVTILFAPVGTSAAVEEGRALTFVSWNLQNYAPLLEPGQRKPVKSARSAEAIIQTLRELRPDILAVCEMGPKEQFAEFQHRLSEAGLHYPHAELVSAADPHRHLALLSRYPFASRQSLTDLPLVVNGTHEKLRRGILDVTLTLPSGQPLRILGIHLKSKLELRDESEALLRRMEAHRIRQHLDLLLASAPDTPLLLYGDLNDTRDQIAVREIAGDRQLSTALLPLPLADAQGDRWTHYWATADLYARIDFVMLSRALSPKVDRKASYLYRHPEWSIASDHRPLVVTFKPQFR